ncbi:MAG: hypothetical protein MI919_42095 [Holophagales bacterium]|nr:hypothetical protein [Holophagales bacterium]
MSIPRPKGVLAAAPGGTLFVMGRNELLRRVAALLERGQAARIVIPQDTGFFTLDPERIDGILELLAMTAAVMRDVTSTFEEDPPEQVPGSALSPQEVADLAFVCRAELLELEKSVGSAVGSGNMWKIAAEGDRAVGRCVRGLIPMEASLRQYSGLEPVARTWFDLDDALEIRRHFVEIWLLVQRTGGQAVRDPTTAMRNLAESIDRLRGAEIYPYLRIDDRLQLRALQKRMLAFLDGISAEAVDDLDGTRLWQDAVAFFDLLMHINRREELRDHDRQLVGRTLRQLYDSARMPKKMPPELHDELLTLASQEPALDALLGRAKPSRSAEYMQPLEALRQRLVAG